MDEFSICFACGKDNPIGLQLRFEPGEHSRVVQARFIPLDLHQGYPGIMHGGLVTTLLDEAMAKVIHFRGITAVTATLEVKFRSPVPIGSSLRIMGELVDEKARRCAVKARIEGEEGTILAEANAIFIKI